MLSKNNQHEQIRKRSQRNYHYAIKNLKIGVFSVAVSVGLSFLGQGAIVQAAELQAADTLPSSATVVDENAKEKKSSQVQPEAVHAETPASNAQASSKPAEVQPEAVKPAETGQADKLQPEAAKPAKAEPTTEVQPVSDEKDNKVSSVEKATSPQAEKSVKEVAQPEKGEEKPAPKHDAASADEVSPEAPKLTEAAPTKPEEKQSTDARTQAGYYDDRSGSPVNTGTPKPINEIEFPEYAGALSHNFFEEGIKGAKLMDFIKANPEIKEALEANNIDWSSVSLEVDDSALKNTRIDPVHGPQIHSVTYGPNREERAADILIRLKYNNQESKPIKLKGIYYKSPYAINATGGGENPSNHTNHNAGKLVVDDPDHIQLTSDQKEKLVNDFLKANPKLGLDKSQLSMADDGNLTITSKANDPNHWTTVVPKTQFISVIAKVPDVIVFKDPKNSGSIPLTHPVVVDLMDGEHILNARGNNAIQANQKLAKNELNGMKLEQKDGKLVISGKLDREDGGTGRYLKVWSGDQIPDKKYGPDDKDYNYLSSWSNNFKIRQLFPNGNTIIRCVDETPNHVTKEEFDNSLDIGLRGLRFGGDKGVDLKKLKDDLNKSLKREWDKGSEYSDLIHEVGTRNFTGKLVTPEGNYSGEVTSTVIYYTEKLTSDILVKDPKNLNPEEKADIASKVKESSKLAPTDKVEIGPDGKVTITFIRDGKKLGTKSFKPSLVTAKYEPQEELVRETEDKTIKAPIKGTKAGKEFTFPEGSKFELPKDAPAGVTLDPKTGEISYKVPKNNQEISLEGSVNVQLPGENHITKVPYKINVQRPSFAKVKYVTSDGQDIDPKFRAEAEDKYPTEIEGKRDSRVIEYAGQKDFAAPKFVGYVFERPQVNGQNQSFNPQKNATLELVYRKLDEIIPADSGQGKPDGYVKVTFKDVEGGKLDQADADKVYFVNPKAGVKISEDGADLVGKDKDGKEQKVALPKVSPDEKYEVNYHKPSADETTTWAYDKYDEVGKEITEDKEFTAQVAKKNSEDYEPEYGESKGKPGDTVSVGVPSFTKDGKPVESAPEGTKFEAPEGVKVNPDGSLEVTIPSDKNDGDVITVPVTVTYPDGSQDTVNAVVKVVDQHQQVEPKYGEKVAKPGDSVPVEQPSFTDKNGQPTKAPEGTKYKLGKDAPQGVTVNPDGSLTVKVPEGAKDGDVITVPVEVTYPDGTTDTVNAKVTVKDQSQTVEPEYLPKVGKPGQEVPVEKPNFTDKDGNPTKVPEGTKYELGKDAPQGVIVNPDGSLTVKVPEGAKDGDVITVPVKVTYPDGTTDTVNAKVTVVDQSQKVEPKYDDKTGTPGKEAKVEKPNFTDKDGNPTKAPEGTKYELGKDAPQGVTVNPDGSLTVKVPEGAKDGDVITVPVKVTYPDGTTDTVNAKVTVVDQSQKVQPKYDDKTGTPGQEVPVEKPNFTEKDGKETPAPEGTKYELGKDAPQGVTVNPDGSLTVKVPEGAKDGDVITVPVKVTYPDGTTDTVNAKVTVSDQSQKVEPKYDDKTGTPGQEVPVETPSFTDKDNNPTKAPEGTKYELGKDAPQGVTVNPDGSLTVKVPEGAKDGDVITVPVKVTYPDGTTDTVEAKVTVSDQSQKVQPKYDDKTSTPGQEVPVEQPAFTDKDGNPTTAPEGTKYELGKDAPQGVTVNPDGSLTVKVPEGAKDGDVITVPVKVTYPDGTTDTVNAKVTVVDQSQKVEPKYDDKTGTPGQEVPVEKPNFTDKDGNPTKAPEGTKYELGKDAPQGVTVNPDGSLTVKVPEGAKDGDVITVPLKVTYPDGTTDTVNAKVTVVDQSQKVEPKYDDKTGTPGQEVPVEKPNFTDKDGKPTTVPAGTKYELGKDAPQGVTVNPDGSLTIKVPEGAKDGDVITVPVKVTYPDGTTDTVDAKVTVVDQSQKVEPKYGDKTSTPGQEVPVEAPNFTDKDGNPTKAPKGTKYELGKDAPQGVTVNPDGSLTVKVPEGAKDGDVITVPVKVTYPDGTTDTVNAKVTVVDQSQKVEPKYDDKTGTPGKEAKVETPNFTDKDGKETPAPEGTKYELGKDAPQGVTVNPDGSLTVKVPEGAKDGDVITVPVKVTYPDGTTDTVEAKVTVSDQSQKLQPKYDDKTGTPGQEVPVEKPVFTDKDGNATPAPEGTKYELGKDAPQGVTVNPDGSLTVKVPEGAKDGDVITVPVKVTYPDGTTDTVNAKVTVVDQSQKVEPKYGDKTGTPGQKVPVEKPNFTDKDGKPTTVPAGTKYELGKDAPQGVTVNPDGSLKVKVPEGAKDGDVITVPVKVTYPDGTTDTVNAKVTVVDQSQKVEPKYDDKTGTPGQEVPVEKPNFTDKDGNPTAAPEGTKYELGKDAPQGVTVNPDGSLKVKVPEGAKDGDVMTVPVKVTYPDGTRDTVNAKVTVKDQSQTVEPKYKDKVGTPGSSVKVDQPEFTGKDGKTTPAPDGTKYELGKDAPQGVTVNPDGSLTVKVPEGAKDGDVITVPVKVSYPDGTSDTVNAKVTVSDQSQTVEPKYKDKVGTPGSSVKVDQPEFTGKDGKTTPAPEGTKYELGKDVPQGVTVNPDGSLTVKVPEGAKDGDVITVPVKVTYPDGTTDTVEAKITVSDQSQKYTPKPVITLVDDLNKITKEEQDQAVKSLKDFNKDLPKDTVITIDKDGNAIFTYPDGTTDLIEKDKVFAERETTLPPVFDKVKEGDKEISGKTEAFAKVIVTIPGLDKPVEVTADEDGNFLVLVPDGVTLKAKDKITATAQGKDKKVSRLGEVLVEEIPTSPQPCPSSPEPASPSPEPSQPSAPQLEDKDHPSQESDHSQKPNQTTETDHSTETIVKEGTQTAATASPNLSRVEEKEESQTEKAAQTENANTSLPKTGVVAAPVALELLLVAAGAILALPSKRKNK
ncbi:YPDG domain-containing protein [Aerococcus urinae]|uniref:YPDG domain-containing protein n=1 Tax=Aerococcus urinae TaxID=1376 RepID=UPI0018A733BF|nr:YPDG domain-containing protein [Aerococcus urinae]